MNNADHLERLRTQRHDYQVAECFATLERITRETDARLLGRAYALRYLSWELIERHREKHAQEAVLGGGVPALQPHGLHRVLGWGGRLFTGRRRNGSRVGSMAAG